VSAPPIEGVLLDLDDTLVDTRAAFRQATAAVAARWLPHLDESTIDEATLRWAHDPGGHFRAYTRGELDFTTQRRRRVDDLHATYGGSHLDDAAFGEWDALYDRAFRDGWTLLPDALPCLDALDRIGVPHGLLTNSTRELSLAKLERLGLSERLALLVSPEDLGVGKPDARVFHLACERLGCAPGHTAYVGDELDVDAQGARAAGLVGVWVDRFASRAATAPAATEGVLVASGLTELPRLLDLGAFDRRR
jgi:putative hydrolase of the HAD superfamily